MKRLSILTALLTLAACSFAPITVSVPDFFISSGSSASQICYSKVAEPISVQFASVVYQGDALYEPGQGVGDNSTISLSLYGRSSDPNPASSARVKCVTQSSDDVLLADNIVLTADTSQRISAGGAELAKLVTQSEYWMGGSLDDGTIFSFPGRIDFTKGVVKANF